MTHYLAELYTPKPAWLALAPEARQNFFAVIGSAMPQLSALGIEAIALGEIDGSKPHAASQMFFALWRLPDEAALDALISGIAASGWHDYFETVNAGGAGLNFPNHIAQLTAVTN